MRKAILLIMLLFFTINILNATNLQIIGEFEGWDDGVVVKLTDGTCWQQAYFYYYYYYFFYPEVELYKKGGITYLKVQGCPEMQVFQVNCEDNINNSSILSNDFNTIVNVQNNTNKLIYFCYSAYNGSNGWQSNGWYKVDAYSYTSIDIGSYNGNIYLYAEYNAGESAWFDSNSKYSFCIDKSNAFNIPNADNRDCSNSNYKRVKMSEFSITPGVFTWTLNP